MQITNTFNRKLVYFLIVTCNCPFLKLIDAFESLPLLVQIYD